MKLKKKIYKLFYTLTFTNLVFHFIVQSAGCFECIPLRPTTDSTQFLHSRMENKNCWKRSRAGLSDTQQLSLSMEASSCTFCFYSMQLQTLTRDFRVHYSFICDFSIHTTYGTEIASCCILYCNMDGSDWWKKRRRRERIANCIVRRLLNVYIRNERTCVPDFLVLHRPRNARGFFFSVSLSQI